MVDSAAPMRALEGRNVLVTGGAGPGMGSSLVRLLLAEGATVVAVDFDEGLLEALVVDLPEVIGVHADPTTLVGADAALAAVPGPLWALYNHAGGGERPLGVLEEVSDDEFDRVVRVNLAGPFMLSRKVLPQMLGQGGGCIINTASVNGLRGARGGPAYAASKWGLIGLTQHIAATYGEYGIRCNAVCPGPTGHRSASQDRPAGLVTERGRALLARDTGKPPPCPPEQVAAVGVFLATDAARRINGAAIPVDGGWIAY